MTSAGPHKLVLDTSILESWEIAARLDMLLAYPDVKPERMKRLINAACADQIRVTIKSFPQRRAELIKKYPHYNPQTTRVGKKNVRKQREDALLVGAAILSLIKEAATGAAPLLPQSMTRLSLDQIVRYLWTAREEGLEINYTDRMHDYEKRKLRSRYPVAHLAAALQLLARKREHGGEKGSYDYQDLPFLRHWVAEANVIAEQISATPGLELMASQLIQIQWIEPEQISAPV